MFAAANAAAPLGHFHRSTAASFSHGLSSLGSLKGEKARLRPCSVVAILWPRSSSFPSSVRRASAAASSCTRSLPSRASSPPTPSSATLSSPSTPASHPPSPAPSSCSTKRPRRSATPPRATASSPRWLVRAISNARSGCSRRCHVSTGTPSRTPPS